MSIEIFSEFVSVDIKVDQIGKFIAKLNALKKLPDDFDLKTELESFGFNIQQDGKLLCINNFDGRLSEECLGFLDALSEFANPGSVIRLKTEYDGVMLMVLGGAELYTAGDVPAFMSLEAKKAQREANIRSDTGPASVDYEYWRDGLYEVGYLMRLTMHEEAEKKSVSIGRKSGMAYCLNALESWLCPDGIRLSRNGPVTEEDRQAFLVELKQTTQMFNRVLREHHSKNAR